MIIDVQISNNIPVLHLVIIFLNFVTEDMYNRKNCQYEA